MPGFQTPGGSGFIPLPWIVEVAQLRRTTDGDDGAPVTILNNLDSAKKQYAISIRANGAAFLPNAIGTFTIVGTSFGYGNEDNASTSVQPTFAFNDTGNPGPDGTNTVSVFAQGNIPHSPGADTSFFLIQSPHTLEVVGENGVFRVDRQYLGVAGNTNAYFIVLSRQMVA